MNTDGSSDQAFPSGECGVVYSMCDNCNHVPMCGLRYTWRNDDIHNLEGLDSTPCAKAYGLIQQRTHPGRLLRPLLRRGEKGGQPRFVPVSWDDAYDFIAEKLLSVRSRYGADAVFFFCGVTKEPRPVVQRLCALFGSANYGTECSTACMRAASFASHLTFGWGALQQYPDEHTRLAVLWGVNPAVAHHYAMPALFAARDRGCRFLIVDPVRTTSVELLGGLHLRPRLGTAAALAGGLARVILHEGLYDEAFCREWIHGFDEWRAYVDGFTPARTEELTGVPAEDVIRAGKLLGESGVPSFMLSSQSTTHDRNGINNHRAICLLGALCGAVPPQRPAPALENFDIWGNGGPADFSMRDVLLSCSKRRIDAETVPAWANWAWKVNTSYLPERIEEGRIRALVSFGMNVGIWPSPKCYANSFAKLDLGVAVDYFYRPASHANMDVLLPAAVNFERSVPFGCYGSVLRGRTALPPRGEAREDWRIALELGCRLGYEEECFHGDPEAACNAILARWGLSMADLRAALPSGIDVGGRKRGTESRPGYATPSGKIEAWSDYLAGFGLPALPEYKEPYAVSPEFPFQLIAGMRRPLLTHSRTRGDCPWLQELEPVPCVEIHPDDAKACGVHDGERVRLRSAWGCITLHVRLNPALKQGIVGVMHGWPEANVNDLIPREFDPASAFPPFKEVPVRLERIDAADDGEAVS